jgi:hypothetical protein
VNEAFLKQYGFSFQYLVAVPMALGRMDIFDQSHFPLSIISEKEIISKLLQCFKGSVDENEIKKIIEFINLDYTTYPHKLLPTNLIRRKERLNLCPLIRLKSGYYLYGNQMCLESSNLWLNSITSGYFPCIQEREINEVLKEVHRYWDKELEKEASEIAKSTLGENMVEENILNFKRLSNSFSKRPSCGEIDLLAINEEKRIVFVIDAKNMNNKNRPYDIKQEYDTFFRTRKSYLSKLKGKEDFVAQNIEKILEYFKVQNFEDWIVKKAFVVNTVYHSAFSNNDVDFVLLQDLSSYLKSASI